MSFTAINTSETLFDVLEADPAFSGLIGGIDFVNDGEKPALLVANSSTPLDGLSEASGLVVVIEKDPTYKSSPLLTAGVLINRLFTIRLLQFPNNGPRNIRAAIERLLEIFPGASVIPLTGNDLVAGDGQAVVKLPSNPVAAH